jgi:hypothetical protein
MIRTLSPIEIAIRIESSAEVGRGDPRGKNGMNEITPEGDKAWLSVMMWSSLDQSSYPELGKRIM